MTPSIVAVRGDERSQAAGMPTSPVPSISQKGQSIVFAE